MARAPRFELPGVPTHVVQRGNNRAACFFTEADRRFYLRCLAESAAAREVALHAYVLMTNHVHLLVTPERRGAVGAMMQSVGRKYVRTVNDIHGRTGTLWEGRYKASVVESERYLLACHRYIELNPVRAGMVRNPGEYAWSSHAYYASGISMDFLTPHPIYLGLGATLPERQRVFRALFISQMDESLLAHIRASVNSGAALGSRSFMEDVAARLRLPIREFKRGKKDSDPFTPAGGSRLL